jgi:AcrR family transcriptional regulator
VDERTDLVRAADRTLSLLWRDHLGSSGGSRGPRPKFGVDDVVRTAVALADAEGLTFSMRQLAERLGLAPMSLYTYVPGRSELVALMVDEVTGESPHASHEKELRARMAAVARQTWEELQKHPWLLQAQVARPWLGPHAVRRYEWQLAAVDGAGFSDLEMDQAVTLLTGFAEGAARAAVRVRESRSTSTLSDRQWWEINAPVLARLMTEEDFPLASRVGRAAGEAYDSISDPELSFAFGLDRLLDGLEALVDRSQPPQERVGD